jgi:cytoskeleton protein RodZ
MSDAGTSARSSAGALLRAARERQGLHVAALAAAIKVTPRKLDALENDRLGELPDATFARALALTVCRTLKIDPKPVLELMPPAGTMPMDPTPNAINEPFDRRNSRDGGVWAGGAIRPMVVAALLLMVAAAALYLSPASWWGQVPGLESVGVAPSAAPEAAPAASAPGLQGETAPPAPAASAAASASAPGTAGAAGAEGAAAAPAAPAGASPAAMVEAPGGALQIGVRETSWIEVREAGGRVLLSRNVVPGEELALDGAAPLRLVIGNASVARVVWGGRAVDLAAHTRDNVARLELR